MNMQVLGVVRTGGWVSPETWNSLQTRYLAPLRRLVGDFWTWWLGELIPLLPDNLQAQVTKRDMRDFLEIDQGVLVLRRGTCSEYSELLSVPMDSPGEKANRLLRHAATSVLLIPSPKALIKRVVLPLATEENLREALSFEIPRRTPFEVDQVYFDFRVHQRDNYSKTLLVELVIAPRRIVDPLLELLAGADIRVNAVSVRAKGDEEVMPINLLPEDQRCDQSGIRLNRLHAVMVAMLVMLVILAVATPLVKKHLLLEQLEPELGAVVSEARNSERLSNQVEGLLAGAAYLNERKRSGMSVLRTLDELTRSLPDHTWISRLDIDTNGIQIQGQSSSAAQLISILESSPAFENVSFRSPVTQIPNTDEERFHLSADSVRGQASE